MISVYTVRFKIKDPAFFTTFRDNKNVPKLRYELFIIRICVTFRKRADHIYIAMKAYIARTTQYVYTFHVVLKAKSHYFPIHHSPTSLKKAHLFCTATFQRTETLLGRPYNLRLFLLDWAFNPVWCINITALYVSYTHVTPKPQGKIVLLKSRNRWTRWNTVRNGVNWP